MDAHEKRNPPDEAGFEESATPGGSATQRGHDSKSTFAVCKCPRYSSCSAPICPLDPDWRDRAHLHGERICGLLAEYVKTDGRRNLASAVPSELVQTLAEVLPEIRASCSDIRHKLNVASRTGSRIESGHRLRSAA